MGKNSKYYKNLERQQKKVISEKKSQLPVYAQTFIGNCELSYQPNTVIAYANDLITFFEYITETNPLYRKFQTKDIPLEVMANLSTPDINDFQKYLNNSGDSEHYHASGQVGIARRMSAVRNFFSFLEGEGYISKDPTLKASKGKRPKHDVIVRMNADEVNDLIKTVETSNLSSKRAKSASRKTALRDTAIITLLLHTGIRVSECVGLDLDDINFNENSISIVRKGGSSSIVYFDEEARIALSDYILHERNIFLENPDERALFLSSQMTGRMCVRSIQHMVTKYASEAVQGKRITPHKLRSTYGTNLYKESGDIYMVAATLGHKSVNTTAKHYVAMDEEQRKQAASYKLYGKKEGI